MKISKDVTHGIMAHYELMMILDPAAGEEALTASIDQVKKDLENVEATINHEDVWGDKKLAYKINKSDRGYYVLFDLELDGRHIVTLNGEFNLNQNVWRYMFVNLDA